MRTSEGIGQLTAALAKASGEFGQVKKDKTADTGSYKYHYADLASTLDATRQPLAKNGLALLQAVGTSEEGFGVTTRLMHSSGEFIESFYPVQPLADIQKTGSLITYVRRYSASAILGIAAEEDDDGQAVKGENTAQNQNRSSQERQRRPQGQPQQPAANPQNQQQTPATPQGEQAQQTQQTSGTQANGSHPVDLEWKKARRLLAALLGEGYLGFTKAKAEEFLKAHGEGKASTSEMTIDQLNACIAAAQQVLTKMRDEAASKATEQAAGQANQEIKDLDDSKPEGE